jgi:peroxiredoxin
MNQRKNSIRRHAVAWLHTIALALAVIAGLLAYPMSVRASPADGSTAPDFVLKSLGGPNPRLSEYRGDFVVLTFWASWCGPCRSTLSDLDSLYRAEPGNEPVILGVNIDGDARLASSLVESLELHYPNLADSRQLVGRLYDVERLPLTLLLDRDGVVRGTWNEQPGIAHLLADRIMEIDYR